MFLEEFYKRILKYSNRDLDEIYNIEKSLISMYIISDKLNIAKYFIEKLSIEDGNGNKAKLARTKDNGIKIEYSSTVLM